MEENEISSFRVLSLEGNWLVLLEKSSEFVRV